MDIINLVNIELQAQNIDYIQIKYIVDGLLYRINDNLPAVWDK